MRLATTSALERSCSARLTSRRVLFHHTRAPTATAAMASTTTATATPIVPDASRPDEEEEEDDEEPPLLPSWFSLKTGEELGVVVDVGVGHELTVEKAGG